MNSRSGRASDTDGGGSAAGTVLAPEGAFNFRDVGGDRTGDGRQVRRGLIFRSGALDGLTGAGWARLAALRVHTVVDLRADDEARGGRAAVDGVTVVGVPMWEEGAAGTTLLDRVLLPVGARPVQVVAAYTEAKVRSYVGMVTAHAGGFGAVVRVLAAVGTLPAVVHCAAGKDRTGLAMALVLRAVGVPEEAVIADYARSRDGVSPTRLDRYQARLAALGVAVADFAPVYAAHPPALRAALAAVDAGWGSVAGYLTGPGGVPPEAVAALRDRLLTP